MNLASRLGSFVDFHEDVFRNETGVVFMLYEVDEVAVGVFGRTDGAIAVVQLDAARVAEEAPNFGVGAAEIIDDFDFRGDRELLDLERAGESFDFDGRHDALLDVENKARGSTDEGASQGLVFTSEGGLFDVFFDLLDEGLGSGGVDGDRKRLDQGRRDGFGDRVAEKILLQGVASERHRALEGPHDVASELSDIFGSVAAAFDVVIRTGDLGLIAAEVIAVRSALDGGVAGTMSLAPSAVALLMLAMPGAWPALPSV